MKKKASTILDFKEGKIIYGFYYCSEKIAKYSKNGDKYLDILLTDQESSIYAKIWNHVNHFNSKFDSRCPVAVKGKVVKYRNRLELNILNINSASLDLHSKYGFKKSLIN